MDHASSTGLPSKSAGTGSDGAIGLRSLPAGPLAVMGAGGRARLG